MKRRPVTRSARAVSSCDEGPRLPPRGLAPAHAKSDIHPGGGSSLRFSEPRLQTTDLCNTIPTRGHAREPSILFHARLSPLSTFALLGVLQPRRAEEPCRLPFFSAPSLAGDVPYLSVPGAEAYGLASWEKRGAHRIASMSSMGR